MTAALPPNPATPQPASRDERLQSTFMSAVIATVVVAAIYFGHPILEPLALAILIAFALSPVLRLLRKIRLGRVLSVLITVLFAVVLMVGVGTFIGSQAAKLTEQLPHYQTNLVKKIQSIRGTAASSSVVKNATAVLNNLGKEIAGPQAAPENDTDIAAKTQQPVPVTIEQTRSTPLEMVEAVAGPLLEPLVNLVMVIVFVGFILLQ